MSMTKYEGSCHCGKVRFEVDLDLEKGSGKCNCSFCGKVRNWSAAVKPEAFKLLTSEQDLGLYQFNTKANSHAFCKNCGVRTHTKGYVEQIGGHFVSVALCTIDNISPEELSKVPVQYMDGLHNNWFNPPKETNYL
ncbi:GFA family protein [Peredibacter starrii]|uniref:GFA family protein n=1 Tax=Peredibacter starrii TaxID=28202 RepID=A0AAX4HJU8_9BACT|nr:GFA family protein [Peredibacter starrii]WPU63524.1 GFA family protein [Peredibacter starrii]